MRYELAPNHDSAKSFYGKASVEMLGESKTLISYDTEVAYLIDGTLYRAKGQPQSATTARHMREFAIQNGYPRMSMSELRKLEVMA